MKLNDVLDTCFFDLFKIISSRKLTLEIFGVSMTLFHYYSYYKSFREFDRIQLAITCFYLGCKLQGTFISTEEALKEYIILKNNQPSGSFDIIKYEVEMLNFLGFSIDIETPYYYISSYIEKLKNLPDRDKIQNLCFNLVNDSYRRPYCLYYTAKEIALSCLFISITVCNQNFSFDQLGEVEANYNKNEVSNCIEHMYNLFNDRLHLHTIS